MSFLKKMLVFTILLLSLNVSASLIESMIVCGSSDFPSGTGFTMTIPIVFDGVQIVDNHHLKYNSGILYFEIQGLSPVYMNSAVWLEFISGAGVALPEDIKLYWQTWKFFSEFNRTKGYLFDKNLQYEIQVYKKIDTKNSALHLGSGPLKDSLDLENKDVFAIRNLSEINFTIYTENKININFSRGEDNGMTQTSNYNINFDGILFGDLARTYTNSPCYLVY